MKFTILSLVTLATTVSAAYKATTTRYYDGFKGACGCGDNSGLATWQLGTSDGVYTAAGSQALFDTNDASWCGGGCGKCYNLTATGKSGCSTCGAGATAGTSIIVMVTNLCPYQGNEVWCPSVNNVNQYGYSYHFDIMAQSEVFGDNAEVEFFPVACPGAAVSDFDTCECSGQLATDETPLGMSIDSSTSGNSGSTNNESNDDTTTSSATTVTPPTSSAAVPTTLVKSTLSTTTPAAAASSTAEGGVFKDVPESSTTVTPVVEPTPTPAPVVPAYAATEVVTDVVTVTVWV